MDPLLIQLASGLAVEGLAAILARSASELSGELSGLDQLLASAIEEVDDVPAISPTLGGESLRPFLHSAEAAALIRRVYAHRVSEEKASIDDLKAEFVDLWAFHMSFEGEPPEQVGRLFDVILVACDAALAVAVEAGQLPALAAQASIRQRQLLGRLDLIHSSIETLRGEGVSAADIERFAEDYRRLVRQREGAIVPPDFEAAPKVPIDSLYVETPLENVESGAGRGASRLGYADLLASPGRRVVLGNPGNGKTTLTKKLAKDYASIAAEEARSLTPFRVVLKNYGARKKAADSSIREFIEGRIAADYQLDVPPGAIEYLLSSGAASVILDGLDELLDTSYRQEIAADIESFVTLYPSVPVLVTSREVGYAQAPLDEALFDTYRLAPFDEAQVETYVSKWLARDAALSAAEQQQQVEAFMAESATVPDLRSNPLMLALMCTIHKGEGYIPRNRPDVYERCALLLFDRWDRQRQIEVPLEIENHIKPAMQYLANWIYTDAGLDAAVEESAIVAKAKEYLLGRRYDDPVDAEAEAKRFVEFCAGRAWVFTDLGTTSDGERLFNFTHRTFLEYFTAGYLVRVNPSSILLGDVLVPHIEQGEWDVVAQLAFQMHDRNVEGGGKELIERLLAGLLHLNPGADVNKLSFAARALEFLVPPPATTREVGERAVRGTLQWIVGQGLTHKPYVHMAIYENTPTTVLESLASISPENLGVMASTLSTYLVEAIQEGDETEALAAAELALWLGNDLPDDFDRAIFAKSLPRLRAIAEQDRGIAVELAARGVLDIESFVGAYGVAGLFENDDYRILPGSFRSELAETIALGAMGRRNRRLWTPVGVAREQLKALAPILLSKTPPWYESEVVRLGMMTRFHGSGSAGGEPLRDDLDSDQWFALAAMLAAMYEENEDSLWRGFPDAEPTMPERLLPAVRVFSSVFLAAGKPELEESAREVEEQLGFDAEQQAFLRRWRKDGTPLLLFPDR